MNFALGQCVITRAAMAFCDKRGLVPLELLTRHARCDWGDLGTHDRGLNQTALREGGRIFSAYNWHGERFYVITEADRSSTCILLATDY